MSPYVWLPACLQETILKRAADLAEVLYSMPRSHNQLALPAAARSPAGAMAATPGAAAAAVVGSGFNSYAGPLTGAPPVDAAANGQWDDAWSHRYPAFTF